MGSKGNIVWGVWLGQLRRVFEYCWVLFSISSVISAWILLVGILSIFILLPMIKQFYMLMTSAVEWFMAVTGAVTGDMIALVATVSALWVVLFFTYSQWEDERGRKKDV
jgi:fumarate reductase subunit D